MAELDFKHMSEMLDMDREEFDKIYTMDRCNKFGINYVEPVYVVDRALEKNNNIRNNEAATALFKEILFKHSGTMSGPIISEPSLSQHAYVVPVFANIIEGLHWETEFKELNAVMDLSIFELLYLYLSFRIESVCDVKEETIDWYNVKVNLKYPATSFEPYFVGDFSNPKLPELIFDFKMEIVDNVVTLQVYDPILYALVLASEGDWYSYNVTTSNIEIEGIEIFQITDAKVDRDLVLSLFKDVGSLLFISSYVLDRVNEHGGVLLPGYKFAFGTYSEMFKSKDRMICSLFNQERFILVLDAWSVITQFSINAVFHRNTCTFGFKPNTLTDVLGFRYLISSFRQLNENNLLSSYDNVHGECTVIPSGVEDYVSTNVYDELLTIRNGLLDQLFMGFNYSEAKKKVLPHARGGAAIKLNQIMTAYRIDFDQIDRVVSYGDAPGSWLDLILNRASMLTHYDSVSDTEKNQTGCSPCQYYKWLLDKVRYNYSNTVNFINKDLREFIPSEPVNLFLSDVAFEIKEDFHDQSLLHEDLFLAIVKKSHSGVS